MAGQSFSITLATTAGDHIQYGLRTSSPIENPDGTPDPWGGNAGSSALVAVPLPAISAGRTGQVTSLEFLSENSHTYGLQYKANLTDALWTNLGAAVPGNGNSLTLSDTNGAGNRYYRLSIQ